MNNQPIAFTATKTPRLYCRPCAPSFKATVPVFDGVNLSCDGCGVVIKPPTDATVCPVCRFPLDQCCDSKKCRKARAA